MGEQLVNYNIEITDETLDILSEKNVFHWVNENGRLKVQERLTFRDDLTVEPYSAFHSGHVLFNIGFMTYTRSALPIDTTVGRYSSIAPNVSRIGLNHDMTRFTTSNITYERNDIRIKKYWDQATNAIEYGDDSSIGYKAINIGNDVWIGQDVRFVASGITVGDGAVIGAGALVTKDVPPYAVVGGLPAKIIKMRYSEDVIQRLLKVKWWDYSISDFEGIKADMDVVDFLDTVEAQIASGRVKKLKFNRVLSANDLK